jgi:hypothetical protein
VLDVAFVVASIALEGNLQFMALMVMMEILDGLLEADGDEEADDDGGDVDEEVAPGVGGGVGWVDVEQGGGLRRRWWRMGRARTW